MRDIIANALLEAQQWETSSEDGVIGEQLGTEEPHGGLDGGVVGSAGL